MMKSTPSWIVLAHLLRPQGRKGELLAELLTDFPERFADQARVFLTAPGFSGTSAEARSTEVVSFSDAESIAGQEVIVPEEERLPLDDESVYISELVGCTIYDGVAVVGVVEDVQFPTTPDGGRRLTDAAPLLVVRSVEGDEVLIPFARAFLVAMDTDAKRIDMSLPLGLVEVNRLSEADSDQKR
jgi:16S rRNA processing protein RimM